MFRKTEVFSSRTYGADFRSPSMQNLDVQPNQHTQLQQEQQATAKEHKPKKKATTTARAIVAKAVRGLRLISSLIGLFGGIRSIYLMIKSTEEVFVVRRV